MVAEMEAGRPRYWLIELARRLSAIAPSFAVRIIDAETGRLERFIASKIGEAVQQVARTFGVRRPVVLAYGRAYQSYQVDMLQNAAYQSQLSLQSGLMNQQSFRPGNLSQSIFGGMF